MNFHKANAEVCHQPGPEKIKVFVATRVQELFLKFASLLLFFSLSPSSFFSLCLAPHIGSDGQEPACRAEETGFNGGVGKIPLEEGMATKSGIVARETHGQGSLVGYSPRGRKEPDLTLPFLFPWFLSHPCLLVLSAAPPSFS